MRQHSNTSGVLALMHMECIGVLRSGAALFWSLAFPLLLLVGYMSFFAHSRIGETYFAILDQDESTQSYDLALNIALVFSDQKFVEVHGVPPAKIQGVTSGVLITIPRGLAESAKHGGTSQLSVSVIGRDSPAVRALIGILKSTVSAWNIKQTDSPPIASVGLETFLSANLAATDRISYLVPGLIVLVSLSASLMGFAVPLVAARESGLERFFYIWPMDHGAILAVKAFARLVSVAVSALLVFGVAIIVYDFGRELSLAGLAASVVLSISGICCFLGGGLVIASYSRSTQSAIILCNLIYFFSLFTGEIFIPMQVSATWASQFLRFWPVNIFAESLRSALGVQYFSEIGAEIIFSSCTLLCLSGIFLLIARRRSQSLAFWKD